MPRGFFFFDCIIRQQPLDEANLKPDDNTEEFQPVTEDDLAYYARGRSGAGQWRPVLTRRIQTWQVPIAASSPASAALPSETSPTCPVPA